MAPNIKALADNSKRQLDLTSCQLDPLVAAWAKLVTEIRRWKDGFATRLTIIAPPIGKTQAALEAIVDLVAKGHRTLYLMPSYGLADEIHARATALGINAAVMRGLGADDPLIQGDSICRYLHHTRPLLRLGADLRNHETAGRPGNRRA